MLPIEITEENFDFRVARNRGTVILGFLEKESAPCRMLSPIMEEIAAERADLLVGRVDVRREPSLAESFGVDSVPTVVCLRDGALLGSFCGVKNKDGILELVDL